MKRLMQIVIDNRLNIILTIVFFALFCYNFVPIIPLFIREGLDPSWMAVLSYSNERGFIYGRDIIFTFGPFGAFWFPNYIYNKSSYGLALTISFLIVVLQSIFIFILIKNKNFVTKVLVVLLIIVGMILCSTCTWFLIPLLFFIFFNFNDFNLKRVYYITLYLFSIVFLSFSSLVKFNQFPVALLSVLSTDFIRLVTRKSKVFYSTLLYVFVTIFLYFLAQRDISYFPDFLRGSFELTAGYSEAMQIYGPLWIIVVYIMLIVFLFMILLSSYKHVKTSYGISYIIILYCFLGTYIFIAFKNGFVRHDDHALQAYSCLCFSIASILIILDSYIYHSIKRFSYVVLYVFLVILVSFSVLSFYYNSNLVVINRYIAINKTLSGTNLLQSLDSEYNNSIKELVKKFGINLNGTVDIFPWDQSYVIANCYSNPNLVYSPRPVFQSYTVYTKYLMDRNRFFYRSSGRPDYVIFKINEIDGRLPQTMEGYLWPDILTLYYPIDFIKDFVVLKKLEEPYFQYRLEKIEVLNVEVGKWVQVPENPFIFAKISFSKNFCGRVRNILYKAPVVEFSVKLKGDNNVYKYRVVPPIVEEGFLLQPFISDIFDFYKLYLLIYKNSLIPVKLIEAFKLDTDTSCGYTKKVKVEFYKVVFTTSSDYINGNAITELDLNSSENLKKLNLYFKLIMYNYNNMREFIEKNYIRPEYYNNNYILFAHVGSKLAFRGSDLLETFNRKTFTIRVGLKEEAFTYPNRSEGASFFITENGKIIKRDYIYPSHVDNIKEFKLYVDRNGLYEIHIAPRPGRKDYWGWTYLEFK